MEEIAESAAEGPVLFEVVGLVTTAPFQQCRLGVQKLHKGMPKMYLEPKIRPMMNVEWEEYTTKIKRTIGGMLWVFKPLVVVVYKNGELLGNESDLLGYINKRHTLSIFRNFQDMGKEHLLEMIQKEITKGRQFAYLTIAINGRVVGTMLFLLYADLVPYTSYRFMEKCKQTTNGFANVEIHRIVYGSWIQCGGFELAHHRMPCENYIIPHDRRGVLSMCHTGKHQKNSVQFFITLAPASWMDTYYVAFGQLVQGAEILRELEAVPTYYESPTVPTEIVASGEFTLFEHYSEEDLKDLDKFISKDLEERDNIRYLDIFDVDSYPDIRRYRRGLYCHDLDLKSYLPGFPVSMMSYMAPSMAATVGEGEREYPYSRSSKDFYDTFRSDTATTISSVTPAGKGEDRKEEVHEEKVVVSDYTPDMTVMHLWRIARDMTNYGGER